MSRIAHLGFVVKKKINKEQKRMARLGCECCNKDKKVLTAILLSILVMQFLPQSRFWGCKRRKDMV